MNTGRFYLLGRLLQLVSYSQLSLGELYLPHPPASFLNVLLKLAQCLYVLTDDNPPAIEEVHSNNTYIACLLATARTATESTTPTSPSKRNSQKEKESQELASERLVSTRLLSAGVLRNLGSIPAPSAASKVDVDRNVVLPLLLPVLSSVQLSEASNRVLDLIEIEVRVSIRKNNNVYRPLLPPFLFFWQVIFRLT